MCVKGGKNKKHDLHDKICVRRFVVLRWNVFCAMVGRQVCSVLRTGTTGTNVWMRCIVVGFEVDRSALGQVFLQIFRFSAVIVFPPVLHAHSFISHRRCIISAIDHVVKKRSERYKYVEFVEITLMYVAEFEHGLWGFPRGICFVLSVRICLWTSVQFRCNPYCSPVRECVNREATVQDGCGITYRCRIVLWV